MCLCVCSWQIVGQSNPGVGEHHGCPYKTFDESNLRAALSKMRVSPRSPPPLPPSAPLRHDMFPFSPPPPPLRLQLPLSPPLSPPSLNPPPLVPCTCALLTSPPLLLWDGSHITEAVRKAAGGHFQLACGAAFEGSHGGCACDAGIQHPNQVTSSSS